MAHNLGLVFTIAVLCCAWLTAALQEPPEGYYAFVESPNAEPPRVRRPPYLKSSKECPGLTDIDDNSAHNLCGDLNKGSIPLNPLRQNVLGSSYPFDLIKNKTLEFFSRTLPILKADDTLPKVARYGQEPNTDSYNIQETTSGPVHHSYRNKRQTGPSRNQEARKFCDNGGGMLCMLYKALNGQSLASGLAERRDDDDNIEYRSSDSLPPTPCPAKVDYATPVFARNHQGVWRYVVQIPYEGYFTQTIEVTRCLGSKCHYMDGGCLSSPRWVSLLVAEIYYPDTVLPAAAGGSRPREPINGENPPPVHDFQNYQQYLNKRAGTAAPQSEPDKNKASHCDGNDDIGCFQVRLYYDWFLVPGSCKCWRPDYFNRYLRRKNPSTDL